MPSPARPGRGFAGRGDVRCGRLGCADLRTRRGAPSSTLVQAITGADDCGTDFSGGAIVIRDTRTTGDVLPPQTRERAPMTAEGSALAGTAATAGGSEGAAWRERNGRRRGGRRTA